ncbi:hypothetical protein [Clostridium algidicarnis]|uniref:hypothetical protein n=1 Tax=Clostridium algidicarnis TaxID=37659 RepID=UPI0018DDB467|nr:hypothetical protein [Clostridium algidicarnis]MBU3227370.1 hypothetical protein [Clostridium algidicarnis]
MNKRYKLNIRWNRDALRCMCLYGNSYYDRFIKTREVLELTLDSYKEIEECMKDRNL